MSIQHSKFFAPAALLVVASIVLIGLQMRISSQRSSLRTKTLLAAQPSALVGIISPPASTFGGLVALEPVAYFSYRRALAEYEAKQYAKSVPLFRDATASDPAAAAPRFFLAISYLMTSDFMPAMTELQSVIRLGKSPYLQAAHMYLAKVYLHQEDRSAADRELASTIDFGGELAAQARQLRSRLHDLP